MYAYKWTKESNSIWSWACSARAWLCDDKHKSKIVLWLHQLVRSLVWEWALLCLCKEQLERRSGSTISGGQSTTYWQHRTHTQMQPLEWLDDRWPRENERKTSVLCHSIHRDKSTNSVNRLGHRQYLNRHPTRHISHHYQQASSRCLVEKHFYFSTTLIKLS